MAKLKWLGWLPVNTNSNNGGRDSGYPRDEPALHDIDEDEEDSNDNNDNDWNWTTEFENDGDDVTKKLKAIRLS